jgi:branched-chain amino acid transport system substrate-binding protein
MKSLSTIFSGIFLMLILCMLASCNPVKKEGAGESENARLPLKELQKEKSAALPAGEFKIGFNLEETGNAATFGVSSHKAAELAVKEINESGMLGQLKLVGKFQDNESKSDKSAQVASMLINQDKVDALVGAVTSSNSIAAAKIVEDASVPMISPASTNPALTLNEDGTVRKWVFRACFTDDFQGDGIVDFAVNGLGAKKAVVLYDTDSDYSVGIWKRIEAVAKEKGLEIVNHDGFLSSSETDFRSKLNKFKSTPFDVLITPIYYNQAATIAKQAREVGITQPILGGDGLDSEDLWKIAGKDVEESVYFTNHYSPDDPDPKVQDFIAKYKQAYAAVPDALAVLAYDSVYMLADALKRAGSTDKAAVRDALEQTKGFQGVSGTFDVDAKHNAVKKLVVIALGKGGAKKMVYAFDPINPKNSGPVAGWAPPALKP